MDMSTVVSKYIGLSEYVNGENKCRYSSVNFSILQTHSALSMIAIVNIGWILLNVGTMSKILCY